MFVSPRAIPFTDGAINATDSMSEKGFSQQVMYCRHYEGFPGIDPFKTYFFLMGPECSRTHNSGLSHRHYYVQPFQNTHNHAVSQKARRSPEDVHFLRDSWRRKKNRVPHLNMHIIICKGTPLHVWPHGLQWHTTCRNKFLRDLVSTPRSWPLDPACNLGEPLHSMSDRYSVHKSTLQRAARRRRNHREGRGCLMRSKKN